MLIDSDLQIEHITEVTQVDGFGLGRIEAFDPRDRRHLAAPPPATAIDIRKRHWATGQILNQGNKPQCVAYTGEQLLASSPVRNRYYKTPQELYDECQANDDWEGNDYSGTSGRALFKVLRTAGYIKDWQNAFDLDTVVRQVLTTSPVAMGTDWFNSMFQPFTYKGESFIKRVPESGNAGGHEWLLTGINLDKSCHCGAPGAGRLTNSWGREFGDNGKVWICLKDLSLLISDGGDAIVSNELKFTPENR